MPQNKNENEAIKYLASADQFPGFDSQLIKAMQK
jgi:hypothetical protein